MIKLATQRFGPVERSEDDLIVFPGGVFGFELHQQWLLLGDREHGGLYWLQNVEQDDLSLAVVDPREFVADYALQTRRSQLNSIWRGVEPLIVLAVLTEYERTLCLNLRNPFVVNPQNRLGRQVVASDDRPLQYALPEQVLPLRKSA
jgi:flagellar assembly factor FliW